MSDEKWIGLDGASFKKLIVPAYVTKDSTRDIYKYILIKRDGSNIISYGTDLYQSYRVNIDLKDSTIITSKILRVCLHADTAITIAKNIKDGDSVIINYISGDREATISVDNATYTIPVFIESSERNTFQDLVLDFLFSSVLEDEPVQSKILNLILFEQMCKAIKTTIKSRAERNNLRITCVRSGERHADSFKYSEWFSALIMPIRK